MLFYPGKILLLLLACSLGAIGSAQAQPFYGDLERRTLSFVRVSNGTESGYTLELCSSGPERKCSYPFRKRRETTLQHANPIILKAIPKPPAVAGTCRKIANAAARGAFTAGAMVLSWVPLALSACALPAITNPAAFLVLGPVMLVSAAGGVAGFFSAGFTHETKSNDLRELGVIENNWRLFHDRNDTQFSINQAADIIRMIGRTLGIKSDYVHETVH